MNEPEINEQSDQVINWNEPMQGNRYLQKLDPRMLLDEGLLVRKEISPVDCRRGEKKWVQIRYDRNYVIEKLMRDTLKSLNPKDYNQLQALLSEAWKQWKKEA